MTNEQTIDAIMKAAGELANAEVQYSNWESSLRAGVCERKGAALRHAIAAALAAKDAEIAECDALRADMASILRAVAIAVRGPEVDGISWGWADLPGRTAAAMNMMAGAVELAREHAAEIAALTARLTDSGCDLQALKARPAPGEWVEWKGGECPIAKTSACVVKFSDGEELDTWPAGYWRWTHCVNQDDNIIAYRIVK